MNERLSIAHNYDPVNVEKVARLATVLEAVSNHPQIGRGVALHGGTALNLFLLTPKRLSLDLDLSYIANEDRAAMLDDREKYVTSIVDIGYELGMKPASGKIEHSGNTTKLFYTSEVTGFQEYIKVDLNFMSRVPILSPEIRMMTIEELNTEFLITSPIELVAGKVKAATERTVPRDLYDLVRISETKSIWTTGDDALDHRLIFFNALLSNRFPNHGPLCDRNRYLGREQDFVDILKPVLPIDDKLTYAQLISKSMPILEYFTNPIDNSEISYFERFMGGDFEPSILFSDYPDIAKAVAKNPSALYKSYNIRDGLKSGAIKPYEGELRLPEALNGTTGYPLMPNKNRIRR